MEIKILFNSSSNSEGLSVGWGLSFLIDNRIIFDTGEKGNLLANNINKLEVDLSLIEAVVISHDHWDHTGGLWEILKQRPNINVYGCSGFSDEFKNKVKSANGQLIENSGFLEISENVYTTEEIKGEYKNKDISEQAIVVNTGKGLTVITGCAHPGILQILDIVRKKFPEKKIYAVFGGFHLMGKELRNINFLVEAVKNLKVEKVGPTHCSGTEAENIFRNSYKDDFLAMKIGETVIV